MSRIIVRLKGGLGNQLFSYAAARRMALKNNSELVIDCMSGFIKDTHYNRRYELQHFNIKCRFARSSEMLEPFSRIRLRLARLFQQMIQFDKRSFINQSTNHFDPKILSIQTKKTIFLEGYFQSEKYFKDIEEIIRSDLEIRSFTNTPYTKHILNKYKLTTPVIVHVRFFNPGSDQNNNLSHNYYQRAITKMNLMVKDAHYFVFSDNPLNARKIIASCTNNFTVVSHKNGNDNTLSDFVMMKSGHHFIIANSTFSWWAAWLATNPQKIIMAPGEIINGTEMAWGFSGLIPDNWIKI